VTVAETISTWRAEICRGVATGHSNPAAERVNRLVKLVYRSGYGFTNVTNQQHRSRYTASRGTRPTWLTPRWLQDTTGHEQPAAKPALAALHARKRHPSRVDLLVEDEDQRTHTVTTRSAQTVAA
jgi:transposase